MQMYALLALFGSTETEPKWKCEVVGSEKTDSIVFGYK